jgi:hypothetical protein
MFPSTPSRYSLAALNELRVILLNARADKLGVASDALTSDVPTFPYRAEMNVCFINLLRLGKGTLYFVYLICAY